MTPNTRRAITVSLSVALTIASGVGYLAADLTDRVPGLLTMRQAAVQAAPPTLLARTAGDVLDEADRSKPIDVTAANALIDALAAADGVGEGLSVIIADASGHAVAERNPTTPREPASTTKLLTAYAAATTLDMGASLDTQVYASDIADGTVTLTLKGNGDMLLGEGENDPDHINGRAGLGTLAARVADALKGQGVTRVRLRYDDTLFGSDRTPANIVENNGENRYYTPIATMAVDGGRQWNGELERPADPDDSSQYPVLSLTPAADAAQMFATRLAEHGLTVEGEVKAGAAPEGKPLASVSSAPLHEMMAFMLRFSDNTLAELFGRLTALTLGMENTTKGDIEAVTTVVRKAGIDTEGMTLTSCSGLAPGTRLSTRTLIDVQRRLVDPEGGAAAVAEGLSVPGLVGTAHNRVAEDGEAGLVRAKTGSLDAVRSFSGNVSRANGGVLLFAVIINDPSNGWEANKAIDDFVAGLTKL